MPISKSTTLLAAVALLLSACAVPGTLPMGTTIDQARGTAFGPSAEYALANGTTRLEFRQGRETYMLDFDASGRLVDSRQVLTQQNLSTIQPGETEDSVRVRFGWPVAIDPIGWQKQHVLDYRFVGIGSDCVWFRVSISNETGQVVETSLGPDPACDRGDRQRF